MSLIKKSQKFKIYGIKSIPKRIKVLRKETKGNFGENLQSSLAHWITWNRNWLISIKVFQSYPSRILMNSMTPFPVCLWMKAKIQKWLKTSIIMLLLKIKKPKGLKMSLSKVSHESQINMDSAKGQLISKCLLGVIVSTKKQWNFLKDFCPSL